MSVVVLRRPKIFFKSPNYKKLEDLLAFSEYMNFKKDRASVGNIADTIALNIKLKCTIFFLHTNKNEGRDFAPWSQV